MNLPDAEDALRRLLTEHFDAAVQGRQSLESPLITVPPSVGKSWKAANYVNRYYRDHGLKSLTFVHSLDMDKEVEGREHWNKWLGHGRRNCNPYKSKEKSFEKGFRPQVDCHCGWKSQFFAEKPTMAAINYADAGLAESDNFIGQAISKFGLRIIDEIDWSRLFAKHRLSGDMVSAAIENHPSPLVRNVCSELHRMGTELQVGQTLAGSDLYQRIDLSLDQIQSLATEKPVFGVWDATAPNFPIAMAKIMGFEATKIQRNEPFNYRLWLNWTEDGYLLNMHWFKRPAFVEPTIVLDATATPRIVQRAFGLPDVPEPKNVELDIPDHIRTLQYIDKRVGKADVERNPEYYKEMLQRWVEGWPKDAEIGIITWLDTKPLVEGWFEEWGFTNLAEPLHFWNLRSRNTLEDVDYLVLFGCPTPDPYDFKDQARAFYFDGPQLPEDDWQTQSVAAQGRKAGFKVKISAYDDQRLIELHEQPCQMELLQAFHRCRPVRGTKPKTVLVATSMPIPGIPVDQILGNRQPQVDAIVKALENGESCKIAQLVRNIHGPSLDGRARTRASKRFSDNKEQLIQLVSAIAFPIGYDQKRGFYRKDLGEPLLDIYKESPKLGKLLSDRQRNSIPSELHAIPQWIFHRNKQPFSADAFPISPTSDDPNRQWDLELVLSILWAERFDGVGYVLYESDPYCVIDLDHCVDVETGEIDEAAREIISELDSYTEFSPSSDGVHIWVKASLDGKHRNKTDGFEIYDRRHYMTVTGNPIPASPTEINERQSEVDALHERIFGVPDDTESRPRPALNLDDREVIERCHSEYADFSQLFDDGAWSGHPSQSEADFRLCCIDRLRPQPKADIGT